jgi:hypothetical protein
MQGRRVQPDENGYVAGKLEPGDYVRVAPLRRGDGQPFSEEELQQWWTKPYWMGCTPNGHAGVLSAHQITEHDDGTITVSPSILIRSSPDHGKTWVELWHGWLERGVWRSC